MVALMSEASSSDPVASAPSKGRTFVIRLGSTLILWTVLSVALKLEMRWLMLLIMAVVGLLGTWEYFRLQSSDAISREYTRWALFFSFAYWAVVMWQCLTHNREAPWWVDGAALVLVLQAAFIPVLRSNLEGEKTLRRLANSVFGFAYTTLLWGYMARVLFFDGVSGGPYLMLLVIMVTKFSDMGAYAVGSWLGKHKMIPHISPGKTWEGFGGAILGSYLAMIVMMLIVPGELLPLTWPTAMLLAPLLCVVAVIGDLAESVLKRCHQIKDSGHKLPGIGGVLDLTDSLIFTAPVCYFFLKLIAG
jgi:phosphatidate cytidylyltransferase